MQLPVSLLDRNGGALMPRARLLKPGFFTNEELAELSPYHRLCYEGLWTIADREGRLEDRPKRIKLAVLPFDEVNIDELLAGLEEAGFIHRYTAEDGRRYIVIPTFHKHQQPHVREAPSAIPAPPKRNGEVTHHKGVRESTGRAPDKHGTRTGPARV